MTDVVSLAAELLALQSTTGEESGAVDYVSRWLLARGWNVKLQEVSRGRANVWASRPGGSGGATFSTHLDTVPIRPGIIRREGNCRCHARRGGSLG
jgi:acetylornithine deacetylase